MRNLNLGLLGLVLAGVQMAGCTEPSVGSDTVRTKGLWASFEVKSTGPSTKVTAQLRVGGSSGTVVSTLVAPDELRVSVDDGPEENLGVNCPGENTFCSDNLGDIGGKEVRVNFDRDEPVENAPNSNVEMPEAFEVSVADDEVVRGVDDVEVTVKGSSASLRYEVKGDCIWTNEGFISDGKIPASAIEALSSRKEEDCDVSVTVRRTSEGTLDPAFAKGGKIVAVQERKFEFFSVAKAGSPDPTTDVTPPDAGETTSSQTSSSAPDAGDAGDAGPNDGGASETSSADSTATGDSGAETSGDGGGDVDAASSAQPDSGLDGG